MRRYKPVVLSAVMGDAGYWIVTVSIAPSFRIPVMVATIGVTQQQAIERAIETAVLYPAVRR
jgi:hypothetical protein